MEKNRKRAEALFLRAQQGAKTDIEKWCDECALNGQASTATVNGAVAIYDAYMTKALGEILAEIGQRIQHRGRAWKRAMRSVKAAVDAADYEAYLAFESINEICGVDSDARAQIKPKLVQVFDDLHDQVAEYRDGWTAPKPKGWLERHPVIYAMVLVGIGVAIGVLGTLATDAIIRQPQFASAPVSLQYLHDALAAPSHNRTAPQKH